MRQSLDMLKAPGCMGGGGRQQSICFYGRLDWVIETYDILERWGDDHVLPDSAPLSGAGLFTAYSVQHLHPQGHHSSYTSHVLAHRSIP